MRQLFVLRHAQAGHSFTGDDHSRTLTALGEQQAQQVGSWMVEHQYWPEVTIVSDAMRTRQTMVWVSAELGEKGSTPYLDSRLYLASSRQLLAVINEVPDTAQSVLVVAHMPGVQDLAMELSSVDSDESAVLSMAEHWPPAGCAVFNVPDSWTELDGRDATLKKFYTPAVVPW